MTPQPLMKHRVQASMDREGPSSRMADRDANTGPESPGAEAEQPPVPPPVLEVLCVRVGVWVCVWAWVVG